MLSWSSVFDNKLTAVDCSLAKMTHVVKSGKETTIPIFCWDWILHLQFTKTGWLLLCITITCNYNYNNNNLWLIAQKQAHLVKIPAYGVQMDNFHKKNENDEFTIFLHFDVYLMAS